jgi:Protein of unknown function (DUF3048) N-terminal domain/Protein of unknown function (DUF3048) C-terminal domain
MSAQLRAVAIGGGVLALALGAFFVLGSRDAALPGIGRVLEPPKCPLTGQEPADEALLDRPAVAVKIENAAVAYPLSGLEKADIVYEEAVEGGITRFMAIYHCRNASKAGPVRSARLIDPAIMTPTTRLLAFSGANQPVIDALREADIVMIQESDAGDAMRRVPREGITAEHTLYAHSAKLRRLGAKEFDQPPPGDSFDFGELGDGGRRARDVTINFSGATEIGYTYADGKWMRSQNGNPFETESGEQIAVDNVLLEEHRVVFSRSIVDAAGNPSIEIADPTGSGRAVLFRDGRAIRGRWIRDSIEDAVRFETSSGDPMMLKPGTTWVELVPSDKGDVKGSFTYER